MHSELISRAKDRLKLSGLMSQLGLGDHAKKSARCPFHEDLSKSFSVFVGDNGEELWNCFAGCGHGDVVDFLAKSRGLNNHDACREFVRLAGIVPQSSPTVKVSPAVVSELRFDWSNCVAALTPEHRERLARWRGYNLRTVEWLHSQGLLGLFKGEHTAFPVHGPDRDVIGCHYRLQDGSWRYHPQGTRTAPLIIGEPGSAKSIWVFESQWDMIAVFDRLNRSFADFSDTAAVATRGASNGRLIAELCAPDAVVYAFGQNDPAGQKWVTSIGLQSARKTFQVITPVPHKDPNDWARADATTQDIEAAIGAAEPVAGSPDSMGLGALQNEKPKPEVPDVEEPDDEGDVAPFPLECLPPKIALMVRATALSHKVPDALPGIMALAVVAASVGKGLVLDWRPGRTPTPANMFALVSAMSGTGKSECARSICQPFLDFERALQERWRKEIMPILQADLRYHEGQLKKLDRKLIKDATTTTDADRLKGQLAFHEAQVADLKAKLHEPQLSIQDATVEKVATVLHSNSEIIFSISSDARKLCDNILGRYSASKKFADDGIYLNAFSGDDVKVDRQGRESVRLANPCLTLLWALQPDALDALLDEDSLQQGGFLARCLLAHTLAEPQYIGRGDLPIPEKDRDRWQALIQSLLETYRQPQALASTNNQPEITEN